MKIRLIPTSLPDLTVIEGDVFQDPRGFFMESWNARDFAAAGLDLTFVQENHSRSVGRVLRGLHYQDLRAPLGKLVRCTVGAIYDVCVDVRAGSPAFGRWYGVELSADNKRQIYAPPGFAHGFMTVTDIVEVQYKQTGYYAPDTETSIAWNDPELAIAWPFGDPLLSKKDAAGMSFRQYCARPAFAYGQTPLQ